MRSTTWEGQTQTMVYRDGTPKGIKAVLEKRGVVTRNMKAADMREKLKSYPLSKTTTLLKDLVHSQGHLCVFYPKYHCELIPIELVWCITKKNTHVLMQTAQLYVCANWSQKGLTALPRNRLRHFSDYVGTMNVFIQGLTRKSVEERIKVYKSHKRVTVD